MTTCGIPQPKSGPKFTLKKHCFGEIVRLYLGDLQ
ncbi:hypothetical protein FOXYSP1_20219 [Fusarium oxysporum f. sp. phaseoli]